MCTYNLRVADMFLSKSCCVGHIRGKPAFCLLLKITSDFRIQATTSHELSFFGLDYYATLTSLWQKCIRLVEIDLFFNIQTSHKVYINLNQSPRMKLVVQPSDLCTVLDVHWRQQNSPIAAIVCAISSVKQYHIVVGRGQCHQTLAPGETTRRQDWHTDMSHEVCSWAN